MYVYSALTGTPCSLQKCVCESNVIKRNGSEQTHILDHVDLCTVEGTHDERCPIDQKTLRLLFTVYSFRISVRIELHDIFIKVSDGWVRVIKLLLPLLT